MNTRKQYTPDPILEEVWRAKDALSASYGHDPKRLFEITREHEKQSGHRLIGPEDLKLSKAKSQ
jgi:hypothetical protein